LWHQSYPRDVLPLGDLGALSIQLGRFEKAEAELAEAMRMEPARVSAYLNLAVVHMARNRFDRAAEILQQAADRKIDGEHLFAVQYQLAFLQGNTSRMEEILAAVKGRPGTEDALLAMEADTRAWHGRLNDARELTRQAIEAARRNGAAETAGAYQAGEAL